MQYKTILVAIGANLPDDSGRQPAETCRWAVTEVTRRAGLTLIACSPWYRSAPVPASGQPDYINGVARYAGPADPHELLATLHAIEAMAGRVRSVTNAARPLDLDLLAMDDRVIASAGLVLPHPRWAVRAFVLAPLVEVAPDWAGPDGIRADRLLEGADRTGISRLDGH